MRAILATSSLQEARRWRVTKVDHFHAAAVGRQVGGFPIQPEVEGRRARPHGVEARRMAHGLQHDFRGQFDDLRCKVHLRAMLGIDLQGLFRRAMDAGLLQDRARWRS